MITAALIIGIVACLILAVICGVGTLGAFCEGQVGVFIVGCIVTPIFFVMAGFIFSAIFFIH